MVKSLILILFTASVASAGQNLPARPKEQDIPAIAKAANGALKPTDPSPQSARAYYEELRKAGGFVEHFKAQPGEDEKLWRKDKQYRTLNGEMYACIPDDTPDMLHINFLTFQAYRLSTAKSAPASPYVRDMTGTDMVNFVLARLRPENARLALKLDSFEELDATTYVTGIERLHDFYFRQGWSDQEEWRFGFGDIGEGNISINSTTMRFSGYLPLLGGVYVTGKCEKIFRRTMFETEGTSAKFDQELRDQGIEVRQ